MGVKVLFIGDPHLKITKFDLAKKFLTWIGGVIENEKPELIVNLGDTFETHAIIRSEIMHEFMLHVNHCLKFAPYVYVVGNHDCFKPNDMSYHALSHLVGKIPNLFIVDKPTDMFDMTFVPYIHDSVKFPTATLPICVAHQTFKGADYGDITTKEGVDVDSITGVELIISGHIHKRQQLDVGRTRVLYVGSPFSQSASDINQIKGVSIIETDTLKEVFIPATLPMWQGLRYEVSPIFSIEELHQDLLNRLNDKDHWVVEITGSKGEISIYLESKRFRSLIKDKDVKIKTIFTDSQKRQVQIEALSLNQIVSDYIVKVYSGSLNKDLLKERAIELISGLNTK